MASCGSLLFLLCLFLLYERFSCFVELECESKTMGQVNHQSTLQCVVKPTQDTTDVKILMVKWTKVGTKTTVLDFSEHLKAAEGYRFAESSWRENMNVSLLISSTKVTDEGEYTCQVITDSGTADGKTSLKVTAKYGELSVSLDPESETPNSKWALRCRASGGYPVGQLRWFDVNKVEWTGSAKPEVNKMADGLFELVSKLPLLPGSTFPNYTCVLFNSSRGKENEKSIQIADPSEKGSLGSNKQQTQTSNIVAPVVVIGSLIVGLLLVLFWKKRSRRQHPVPTADPEDVDVNKP